MKDILDGGTWGRVPMFLLPTLILSACVSVAPPAEPVLEVEVPREWSAAESMDVSPFAGAWWTTFGDPGLDRMVTAALDNNYDLRAASAAVDAALAQARITGAELKPRVSAGLDSARRQQIFVGLPIPGRDGPLASRSTSYGTSLNISWEPDLWGRLRAGQRAALGEARAAEIDYRGARLSLAGQVAKAWFAMREAEHQVELATQTVSSRRETTERVEARYRRGVAQSLDVRLARSSQAQAESSLELRRRQLDGARRQVQILTGSYPDGEVDTGASGRAAPGGLPPVPPAIPAGLPSELVTRRPDLLAAESRAESAGWRVREARRALYPRVTLTGSTGMTGDSLGDLVDGDFSVWSVAGGLLAPLFQGGRLRAAVEFAEASQEGALARYAQSVLRAFAEVESALAAERLLAAEEAAQAVATEESRAAAELAEDRYLAGVGEYLSILESQRQAFNSESRLLTLRTLRLTHRVDFHLALGGDFGASSPAPPGEAPAPSTPDAPASTAEPTTHLETDPESPS